MHLPPPERVVPVVLFGLIASGLLTALVLAGLYPKSTELNDPSPALPAAQVEDEGVSAIPAPQDPRPAATGSAASTDTSLGATRSPQSEPGATTSGTVAPATQVQAATFRTPAGLIHTRLAPREELMHVYPLPEAEEFSRSENRYANLHPWQPEVVRISSDIACSEIEGRLGRSVTISAVEIGGHTFCHERMVEGAAGSRYTTHAFMGTIPDGRILATFTTRSPNCSVFDTDERDACRAEAAALPHELLADILSYVPEIELSLPEAEGVPTLTGISPSTGEEGAVVTLSGSNLAGYRGSLGAWLIRDDGKAMYLPSHSITSPDEMQVTVRIPAWACTYEFSAEDPCRSHTRVLPGVYDIYVVSKRTESNRLTFTVEGPDCVGRDEDACAAAPACTARTGPSSCSEDGMTCSDDESFLTCHPKTKAERAAERELADPAATSSPAADPTPPA